MNCIHENEVNKISEMNLLNNIVSPSKHNTNINSHYSHILHEYLNTQKVGENFGNFRILFDS